MNKTCTKCKETKPKFDFYKDNRRSDGLRSWCKVCHKEDNREREAKYNETRRRWREENSEKYKENKREYYKNNKETILTSNKMWRNTLKGRLASYIRSAKTRRIPWTLTENQFKNFWREPCTYCGDPIDTIGLDRVDNTIGYELENVVPCCSPCNTMKMTLPLEEFVSRITKIYERLHINS